ncbi:hypothetical protein BR63_05400 [Thermanaerosceptrum fracticalcis]|uniref:Uncharacterized protein n=1 Tax=Thermanaerosceptrum fracticalcis TaxID=1712410 RepID=A0A7G6E143_THEFR|nr:hypothetical protein [Thermanaerosceptrum fracticalcis]QNB45797.1 hypothetical protein BR63_05400 [Thermanaerosceptrum fracticalcis]
MSPSVLDTPAGAWVTYGDRNVPIGIGHTCRSLGYLWGQECPHRYWTHLPELGLSMGTGMSPSVLDTPAGAWVTYGDRNVPIGIGHTCRSLGYLWGQECPQ